MIINTYPMGDQQPTPEFVREFYERFREFLLQHPGQFDTTDDAIKALIAEHGIQASVCFQKITFNELEPDYDHPYIIFGWPTEEHQQAFIDRFDSGSDAHLVH